MKLSAAQIKALQIAHDGGGVIQRYPGGFWAAPGVPWTGGAFPVEYSSTNTVQGLVRRRLLEPTSVDFEAWRGPYRLSDAGREHYSCALLHAAIDHLNTHHPLPRCRHDNALRDHAGDLLEPSCGCRHGNERTEKR